MFELNDKSWTHPKLQEFAEDNSRFDKNRGKSSKKVEYTVGKGEIAS